ncbi:MAG: tetratricopeptide repeat protein [Hydrogenothermaceae bacterium]
MRKFFLILSLIISFSSFGKDKSKLEEYYQSALEDYSRGSYYSALDTIEKALVYQKDKKYKDVLLLVAKIYLEIGKKTGLKQYLWKANYYLNMYIQAGGEANAEYYYTKALVFERLSFFERAFTLYKMALMENKDNKLNNKIIFGLMRTAIMIGNVDAYSKYLIYLAPLTLTDSKELTFLTGMKYFYEGKYFLALQLFKDVYNDFELYLLDNPDFYFYVGETAFLNGDYDFAKKIFRRIVSVVKNDDVIRKSYIRLGDIALIQKDKNEAFNNYLIVINKFPETDENTIAKLKMLALEEFFPDLKPKIEKIKDLQDPIKFIVKTLIINRTNYIGKYAIANFGVLVFKNRTDYLIDRLSWELSLLHPLVLDPDQKWYIYTLWKPYILKIDDKDLLKLYSSNPKFFMSIFDRQVFIKILDVMDKNNFDKKSMIKLLEFMVSKYGEDEDKRKLASLYYNLGQKDKALQTLQSIKDKNCSDELFIAVIENKVDKEFKDCDISSLPITVKLTYELDLYKKTKSKDSLYKLTKLLSETKSIKDSISKEIIDTLEITVKQLYNNKDYNGIVEAVRPYITIIANSDKKCDILPYYLISEIRTSNFSYVDEIYNKINSCKTEVAFIAIQIYKDQKLFREVK